MSPEEIAQTLVRLVGETSRGAEGLAKVELGRTTETRFAVNEITTAGDVETSRVQITVARGKRHATASQNRVDPESLRTLVKRAVEMASLAPEDPEWLGVLGPGASPGAPGATFDAPTFGLSSDARATAVKKAISVAEAKGVLAAGFYVAEGSMLALASTAGLAVSHPRTTARLTITARSQDGTGSGWAGTEEVASSAIDAGAVSERAVDKALRSQKPRPAKPGAWKIVLDPACVAELLGFFFEALDARSTDEGRSFFAKKGGGSRLGEPMFAKGLSLKGDPFDPLTPSVPFDDDGLPMTKATYIEDGTLRGLVTSRYWAQKTGKTPSPMPSAIHLLGGQAKSVEELISKVDRGLYVTRFWYTRWLDPQTMSITGLTRDGVFLIENGKIQGPVNNFRFNESPANVFAKAQAWTTATVRVPSWGQVVRVPALLTEDFHMASVSAAV
jgi:predicted Zn-dependent protease